MKTRLLFLWALVAALLGQNSLWASEELEEVFKEPPPPKRASSFMTHQDVADKLSQELFCNKKLRIQIALTPATQEYLTEEFITIVQNLSQKMDIYEKCYVIRAVMKLPVEHIITLKELMVDHLEQLQLVPGSERVSFIKKLHKIEPSQWQDEIASMIKQHRK